jgi:hypothetical protein
VSHPVFPFPAKTHVGQVNSASDLIKQHRAPAVVQFPSLVAGTFPITARGTA